MTIGKTINLYQDNHSLKKALDTSKKILTEGEIHLEAAVQKKPIINYHPHSIVVTNKRVIKHQPHLFKATFKDYLWKDLRNVHLIDRFFGSTIVFQFSKGIIVADRLPKEQAKKVYAVAQAKEEEWVEKRRLRTIEEERARSGANHIIIGKDKHHESDGDPQTSPIRDKLLELQALLNDGLVTQDEYQIKKMELLKR